jgi:hypothetical protein
MNETLFLIFLKSGFHFSNSDFIFGVSG